MVRAGRVHVSSGAARLAISRSYAYNYCLRLDGTPQWRNMFVDVMWRSSRPQWRDIPRGWSEFMSSALDTVVPFHCEGNQPSAQQTKELLPLL